MIVVYLDLLGFSNYVFEDMEGATRLIYNYVNMYAFRKNPNYQSEQKGGIYKINSFSNFLPFSDSIFITSEDQDLFFPQLSQLLVDTFLFRGAELRYSSDPVNPYRKKITSISLSDASKVEIEQNWFPALFRGGAAIGDIQSHEIPNLSENIDGSSKIITGPPVVESVKLESDGHKGPRILFKKSVYENLGDQAKLLVDQAFDYKPDYYELYWPGVIIMNTDNFRIDLQTNYPKLLDIGIVLWKANKNNVNIERHYYNFIKLIYRSTKMIIERNDWDISLFNELTESSFRIEGLDFTEFHFD